MSRAPAKPAVQMAFITIGHSHFLMEASKGMKVVELMQHAVQADWDYRAEEGRSYTARGSVDVELRLVRADQIHMPQGESAAVSPSKPRLLR